MSDIYLSLTETPAVVTLSQPVAASQVAATVTVGNTVTVALDANSLAALESVTVTVGNVTIGSAVTIAGFSTSSLPPSTVTVSNFPSTQTIAGTVTANVGQDYGALVISESVGNQDNGTFLDISQYPSGTLLQVELGASAGSAVRKFEYRDSNNQYPDGDIVLTKAYDNSSTQTNFGGGDGGSGVWVFRKSKDYFRASFVSAGQGTNTISYKILAFSNSNRGFNQTVSGTVTVGNTEGWGIGLHDYRSFSYSGSNLSQIVYKTGGSGGTTVGTITLAYDGSGNLTSMTKS